MRPIETLRIVTGLCAYVTGVAIPAIGVPILLGSLATRGGVGMSLSFPGWWVIAIGIALSFLIIIAPRFIKQTLGRLPESAPPDSLVTRVRERAARRNIESLQLRFVEVNAPTMCAYKPVRGEMTLVVSARMPQLATDEALESAIDHMLVRTQQPQFLVTTVMLPLVLAVETATRVAVGLVARRQVSGNDSRDRRGWGPQNGSRYAKVERQIPSAIWAFVGLFTLVIIAPLWVCVAIGDRFVVSGSRRMADRETARDGNGESLATLLTNTRDADGRGDWPPALDRLSLLALAEGKTRSFRGTSRNEERVRAAQLMAKRI